MGDVKRRLGTLMVKDMASRYVLTRPDTQPQKHGNTGEEDSWKSRFDAAFVLEWGAKTQIER